MISLVAVVLWRCHAPAGNEIPWTLKNVSLNWNASRQN
jgi:hypothetical protein